MGSIRSIVDSQKSSEFNEIYTLLKERGHKERTLALALIEHTDTPEEIKNFITASLTSAKQYIADVKEVYTLENAKNPKSDLGKLMKPALLEHLIKQTTILTPESVKEGQGVSDARVNIASLKNSFAANMSAALKKQIESGKGDDIISDAVLKAAISTPIFQKPPAIISTALQTIFRDEKNTSPSPKISFVDLSKLENLDLQTPIMDLSYSYTIIESNRWFSGFHRVTH